MAAREALASTTLLTYPNSSALTSIMCDALDAAVGAVLQQYIGNWWCPIAYMYTTDQMQGINLMHSSLQASVYIATKERI